MIVAVDRVTGKVVGQIVGEPRTYATMDSEAQAAGMTQQLGDFGAHVDYREVEAGDRSQYRYKVVILPGEGESVTLLTVDGYVTVPTCSVRLEKVS